MVVDGLVGVALGRTAIPADMCAKVLNFDSAAWRNKKCKRDQFLSVKQNFEPMAKKLLTGRPKNSAAVQIRENGKTMNA